MVITFSLFFDQYNCVTSGSENCIVLLAKSVNSHTFPFSGDCGRSSKPAKVILVATHADSVNCKKNVVGEFTSPQVDSIVGTILAEYGNFFNIHAHAFIIDTNATTNSPSIKGLKAVLCEYKSDIIEVRL